MNPIYTVTHNRGTFWNGDTLPSLTVQLTRDAGRVPIVPQSVCAQISAKDGTIKHTYAPQVTPDGAITLPSLKIIWGEGVYSYNIKYTMADGYAATYFAGDIKVLKEKTEC